MFRIQFPTDNPHGYPILFFGERSRHSTMTSVRLLSPGRLVAANYIHHRLHLVDFDLEAGTTRVRESLVTRMGEIDGPTDLLDFDEDTRVLALSHFTNCGISFYRLGPEEAAGPALRYVGAAGFKRLGPAHGIAFDRSRPPALRTTVPPGIPRHVVLATSYTRNPNAGTYAIDLGNPHATPAWQIRETGWLSKDLCFCGERADEPDTATHVVNIFCDHAPKPDRNRTYRTKVCLYRLATDGAGPEKCDEHVLDETHCDCCIYDGRRIYVTTESDTRRGEVRVYDLDAAAGRLRPVGSIPGYHFPHGIDVRYGLLAVSEYGNCAVAVESLAAALDRLVPA